MPLSIGFLRGLGVDLFVVLVAARVRLECAGELLPGRGLRGRRGARVRGALLLALDFPTWQTLTTSGLDDADAAQVATAFVAATLAPGRLQREAA